jgi:spoIIIJ-associated protein
VNEIMQFQEFTGKTVKEAVAKACQELNTDEALLEIEVLEESTRGFLGIVGQRDARVRVRKRNILDEVMEAEASRISERSGADTVLERAEEPEPPDDRLGAEPSGEDMEPSGDLTEAQEEAKTILTGILERMLVDAEVHASIQDGAIYLDMKGDGSGLLIGKKGQTLDALQFVVSKIVNKSNPPGFKVEVVVDTENYRMRKTENLREMALKMSEKAKKTLKPVSLNPMPPSERRIVHLILAEEREVYTKSYGEGALRRIIVYPRRGLTSKRRRR